MTPTGADLLPALPAHTTHTTHALVALPIEQQARAVVEAFLGAHTGHTQKAYRRDLRDFLGWLNSYDMDPLQITRPIIEAYVRHLAEDRQLSPATVGRHLSSLSSLYRYAVQEGLMESSPVAHVRRPKVDGDSPTTGLDREEARALLATTRTTGSPRDLAVLSLLLLNGLRISEALGAQATDLDTQRGHRTLTVIRKGGKRRIIALAPATVVAIEASLGGRTDGPLFATSSGRPLDPAAVFLLVRRMARRAGIAKADRLSPHSLRHAAITLALDAGVSLRDVQDYAGHADPRTTRRYDRGRDNLDRHATYAVAAYLADAS